MSNIKYSIIIPTYNKLEQYLKPCVDSILRNTTFENKELIIVSNGCQDGTYEWLQQLDYPFLKFYRDEKPLGYAKAINLGYEMSEGEYVILLNNDTIIENSGQNEWINLLQNPFDIFGDCGATGPIMNYHDRLKFFFLVFCCVMIKRNVFDEIGWMNEVDFPLGAGEDIDFCYKLTQKGYTLRIAPHLPEIHLDKYNLRSSYFPLTHFAEGTVHDTNLVQNWEENFHRNMTRVADKYLEFPKQKVLAEVCTKGRYLTTLPLALQSVLTQTHKPDSILILDNTNQSERKNMLEIPTLKYLLDRFMTEGIQWYIIYGDENRGQHVLHEIGQNKAKELGFPLVWRIDDDTFCEANVLEELLTYMAPEVGAVACSIITPPAETLTFEKIRKNTALTIQDIIRKSNTQWFRYKGPAVEVQHLYSSFLYRVGIANYDLELSPVAHREETLFSHAIYQAGKKLIVTPNATVWHYRNPEGGIRSTNNNENYERDEAYFFHKLNNVWGINFNMSKKTFFVSNGIGDHFVFKRLIPELKEKYNEFNIACVFPDVFYDMNLEGISVVSLQEGIVLNGEGPINIDTDKYNPYALASKEEQEGKEIQTIEYYYRKLTGLL